MYYAALIAAFVAFQLFLLLFACVIIIAFHCVCVCVYVSQ